MNVKAHQSDLPIGRYIWESRYRWQRGGEPLEQDIEATWSRVATAVAAVEVEPESWREKFFSILRDYRFLPGGRILAGAGTDLNVTLFNCFVMGVIKDDMSAIFESLREGAVTMQAGGGVGYDFSTLRPRGAVARSTGNIASGPVSYMHVWNAMCETLLSTGARRGAMIATLRCDHPDILQFVAAKQDSRVLSHFNLSVQVTDEFMKAVSSGENWPLVFPVEAVGTESASDIVMRSWPGYGAPVPCAVMASVGARSLWHSIMTANYEAAEPGVLFVDRINEWNNLRRDEQITCTNPCGEIPLPPYGACNLGSINLTRFVTAPFTAEAAFDYQAIAEVAGLAVRFLDNVIDCSKFPLPQQYEVEHASRRIGLGVTGLADALIMAGLEYGAGAGRNAAARVMATVCHAAYRASAALAREKGSFPRFDKDAYLGGRFIRTLPGDIRRLIEQHGTRNSHLLAIAPAGTISLLAGNVSSGIEPVFDAQMSRLVMDREGNARRFDLVDYALNLWRSIAGDTSKLPAAFVTVRDLDPYQQLAMQSALTPYVDNAISKTVNVPRDYPFEAFQDLYRFAWRQGLKGCTSYRQGSRTGQVLSPELACDAALDKCCTLD